MNASTSGHKVEVISKEMIKPSSPTPHHLKNYKLSLLDQLAPTLYLPLIFFYEADNDSSNSLTNYAQISNKLKQSLSNTLTLFYPLAGKLDQETLTIDCNDAGVEFTEARVLHTQLSDVIQNPTLELLKDYIPVNVSDGLPPAVSLAVQITTFDCGGIAIGFCMSHQIGDGTSAFAFMNSWAKICRGGREEELLRPSVGVLAEYFPVKDLPAGYKDLEKSLSVPNENLVTKRYLFDKKRIEALKLMSATGSMLSSDNVENPTRVELVSAFIWKHFINDKWNRINLIATLHSVNLRPRSKSVELDHENVFGNYFIDTVALSGAALEQNEPELGELVGRLRHSIRKIDDEYIRNAQSGDGLLDELGDFIGLVSKGELDFCIFSSWCRFPVYDVDFGWGKPAWVGTTPLLLNNLAVLWSTKSEDGIDAWVNMIPDNTTSFDADFELLGAKVD